MNDYSQWSLHSLLVLIIGKMVKDGIALQALKSEVEKFLRPRIVFYIGNTRQRRIKMLDNEQAVASIELDDAKGFPTGGSFDQPPAWSIDDPSIATLTPSDDGMSCNVVALKPGNAQLSVAAVLGGQSFAGQCPVTVIAGAAASIKVTLGTPTPQ